VNLGRSTPGPPVEVAVIAPAKRVDVPRGVGSAGGGSPRRRRRRSARGSPMARAALPEGSSETSRVHRFPSKNRKERCSRGSACQPRVSGCGGRSKGSSRPTFRSLARSSAVSAFAESGRWVSEKSGTFVVRDAAA